MRDQGDLDVLRKRVIAWWGQYGERFTERTRIWCLFEKKNCSREILVPPERTLWRASSLDGPSLPRGFPFELEVQPPNTPPGALARVPPLGASPSAPAEIPPPSTSPSVLAVSSNLERSRPQHPLLALKFYGQASLRAYLSWCSPVSPRAHWSSKTILSRLRFCGRSLSTVASARVPWRPPSSRWCSIRLLRIGARDGRRRV